MRSALRIYSETADYARATSSDVLGALASRGVELVLAVRPWNLPELARAARAVANGGVALSVWPMLADADGRFVHSGNVARARDFTLRILDVVAEANVEAREVLVDLELPVRVLRDLWRGAVGRAAAPFAKAFSMHDAGSRAVSGLRKEIEARGVVATAAMTPPLLWDSASGMPFGRLAGVAGASSFGSVDLMAYTTLFRRVPRKDALDLLALITARSREVAVSSRIALGCVGTGALGDEPTYRDPLELAEDVAVARGAGARELSLLDLGGVLARRPIEAWLDVLVETEPARLEPPRLPARILSWSLARTSVASRRLGTRLDRTEDE